MCVIYVCVCALSCLPLCDSMDCSLPGFMEFSRQEYWSGLSFPSPGHLPDAGVGPVSPTLAGRFFTAEPTEKLTNAYILYVNVHGDVHSEILKENLFRMRSHNEIESFKN